MHTLCTPRFFNHLTRRDLGALFQLLAPEVVYENAAMQVCACSLARMWGWGWGRSRR